MTRPVCYFIVCVIVFPFPEQSLGKSAIFQPAWGRLVPDAEVLPLKEYKTSQLRNVALVSHGGAGKTAFAEAMLRGAGVVSRLGRSAEGNTAMDYTQDEIERKISINLSVAHLDWKDNRINVIDTPGYADFSGDTAAGLRVADGAVLLINSPMGLEPGGENVWDMAMAAEKPVFICVNMMDKENADFDKCLSQAQSALSDKAVPVLLPIGAAEGFKGVVDLINMKAYMHSGKDDGSFTIEDIPGDMADAVEAARTPLMDAAAESDDELLEKYLDSGELTAEELSKGLRAGIVGRTLFPVAAVSAYNNIGVTPVMDMIAAFMPSPEDMPVATGVKPGSEDSIERAPTEDSPFSALVFKSISEAHVGEVTLFRVYSGTATSGSEVYNPISRTAEKLGQIYLFQGKSRAEVNKAVPGDICGAVKLKATHTGDTLCTKDNQIVLDPIKFPKPTLVVAMAARTKGEEDKVGAGLAKLREEDRTLLVNQDVELKQTLVSGMGDLHLEVILGKLKKRFNVEVDLEDAKIKYREAITKKTEVQGRYKKQTGGRGQFGDVFLRLEPQPRGAGFEFVDAIVGGKIPSKFIPAVEKGVVEAMKNGIQAGHQVVDVKATVYEGSYHTVDSSDMAFKIAASMAFKKAAVMAGPILLEPIMEVEVLVPEQYTGDIMGDMSSRRGKILGMNPAGKVQSIKALVPQAELNRYATQLRAMTQGRGVHTEEFHSYEVVPRETSQKVIEAYEASKAKD
jgi:elongation factor G